MASALAFRTTFDDPGNIEELVDDAIGLEDALLYADDSGDTGSVAEMIEQSFTCDCGNDIYVRNQCTRCGASAPWASKLGCGLA